MTKKQHQRQQGFTLIEMIAVLVLVGILSTFAGLGIVKYVQSYLFAKDNAAISANAQLAIARINRELLQCNNCSPNPLPATQSNQVITLPFNYNVYDAFYDAVLGQRYIRLYTGTDANICLKKNCIQLSSDGTNYDTLLDNVDTFSMTYNVNMTDGGITVRFHSSRQPWGQSVGDFVTKVYPRNTPIPPS